MVYRSSSPEETQKIAEKTAQEFKNKGGVIALSGDLGAGKTTFVQGFAKGLGIEEKIISPTFVLIRQHKIPGTARVLFHVDLYRLEGEINLKEIGLEEVIQEKDNIVLIEWAEKASNQPLNIAFDVFFEKIDGKTRNIVVNTGETK